ncbi:DUF2877 domain-containing protein [Brevibacillus sp. SYSU BS000544]|uniref:DUF2877 domain-containing protein n=1 Tax=Brevibacillus sp. SYSU BS000544 TaxID=3416443 RepID=UPI003CE4B84E
MTVVNQARSGDAGFIQRIEDATFYGFVHSTFDRTINIHCLSNAELYTVACRQIDNGPNTLVTDVISFSGMDIAAGDIVYVENDRLCIENKMAITIEHAKKWQSIVPAYPADIAVLRKNLAFAKEYIELHGAHGGMKRPLQTKNLFEEETSKMLEERSRLLLLELSNDRMIEAIRHAVGLIGLGPGLTPSGDDFLVGLLTTLTMPNYPVKIESTFGEAIVQSAQQLTNEISFMAIKKASTGEVRESIIALLHALTCGSQEESILSLATVLNIGSSSGTDIALGIVSGLEISAKDGGRICLQKLS